MTLIEKVAIILDPRFNAPVETDVVTDYKGKVVGHKLLNQISLADKPADEYMAKARAAIATVLREMMRPNTGWLPNEMWAAWWKTNKGLHDWDGTTGLSGTPVQRKKQRIVICFNALLRAFAAEHGITLDFTGE